MRTDSKKFLKYCNGVDSAMQANFPIFIRQSVFHDWVVAIITDTISSESEKADRMLRSYLYLASLLASVEIL